MVNADSTCVSCHIYTNKRQCCWPASLACLECYNLNSAVQPCVCNCGLAATALCYVQSLGIEAAAACVGSAHRSAIMTYVLAW